jgi:hypothetical protein
MKKCLPLLLFLICCLALNAQVNIVDKKNVYEAWIKLANNSEVSRGIIYEISDSSIFFAPSLQTDRIMEFRYDNINLLKVRRAKNIRRGSIAGSVIGFGLGSVAGLTISELPLLQGILAAGMGFTAGAMGLGAGAIAGSVKDRIPVRSSYENFEKYKGTFQYYSFLKEKAVIPKFVHRGYFSPSIGFSRAAGEFAASVPVTNYQGMNLVGSSLKGEIGYFFTKNLGISLTSLDNSYTVGEDDDMMLWNFHSQLIGPIFSLPASDKLRFDFTPQAGYSMANLYNNEEEFYTGHGFGISFSGKIAYITSKRWNVSASTGYASSIQKYEQGGSGKAQAMNLTFGLDYKFGKKSL